MEGVRLTRDGDLEDQDQRREWWGPSGDVRVDGDVVAVTMQRSTGSGLRYSE